MSPGTFTVAVLSLALAQANADVVPINSRNFQIPIVVKNGQRDKIKEMLLFCSTDQGATWNQAAVATPDKDAFTFYAPKDGLYWFNISVVDANGNREPDIYKTPPRQKVLIDTVKPSIRFTTAERQGDEVVIGWEIQELNPNPSTLKLEYRTADGSEWSWYPVSAASTMTGQARFKAATASALVVRLQMSDLAGNLGTAQTDVAAKPAAAGQTPSTMPPPPVQSNPAPAAGTSVTVPATAGSTWSATGSNTLSPPAAPTADRAPPVQPASLNQTDRNRFLQGTQMSANSPADAASRFAVTPNNANGLTGLNPTQAGTVSNPYTASQPAISASIPMQQGAQYSAPVNPTPQSPLAGNYANGVQSPAVQRWPGTTAIVTSELTNSTQVTLDYEVKKKGPSGIKSVELYLTDDDGRTWRPYEKKENPALSSSISTTLPGEGVFGLRLVFTSGAGLKHKPPQPGELPQMRIEVDTTPPAVKFLTPTSDPGRRDILVLNWSASDKNLASNPITLEWAEKPDGPWNPIASELPNAGRYNWHVSSSLPCQVYLRITARDSAGNVGTDEFSDPVLIDNYEPEGQLIGLSKSRSQALSMGSH